MHKSIQIKVRLYPLQKHLTHINPYYSDAVDTERDEFLIEDERMFCQLGIGNLCYQIQNVS